MKNSDLVDTVDLLMAKKDELIEIADKATEEAKALDFAITTLSKNFCDRCSGRGKLREWICQDESNIVECNICKGTGIAC